jgi:hypothetical protein
VYNTVEESSEAVGAPDKVDRDNQLLDQPKLTKNKLPADPALLSNTVGTSNAAAEGGPSLPQWLDIAVGVIAAARDDGLNLKSLRRQCWSKVGKEK